MIKPEDQLKDSGAVIGYRPELKYEKEYNGRTTTTNTSTKVNNKQNYSNTVKSFSVSSPSKIIANINDTMDNINTIINRLSKIFESKKYDKYSNISSLVTAINNNNTNYAKEFIDYHKFDISKSQIPEIVYELKLQEKRLEIFKETYKTLYYGTSNISDEVCKQKDEEMLSVIRQKDTNKKGLNYLTLSYDSIINKSINIYTSKLNDALAHLEEIAHVTDDVSVNPMLATTMQYLFTEADDEINYRKDTYDMQQNIDTMRKTLYNYYIKRSDLNKFYNVVTENANEGDFLLGKISKYETKLNNAIEDVNRIIYGNVHYLNSLEGLMTEKQHLRSIYATISYN